MRVPSLVTVTGVTEKAVTDIDKHKLVSYEREKHKTYQ
jgi:hypothetical protein